MPQTSPCGEVVVAEADHRRFFAAGLRIEEIGAAEILRPPVDQKGVVEGKQREAVGKTLTGLFDPVGIIRRDSCAPVAH